MLPALSSSRASRLLYSLFSLLAHYASAHPTQSDGDHVASLAHLSRRAADSDDTHSASHIVFIVLIPVLVLLSGLFAGLTLGYMSLDETQLHVLSISGTECVFDRL
jgi:metal transporter CNNM